MSFEPAAGAICAVHSTASTGVCTRCGNFVCDQCAPRGPKRVCEACRSLASIDVDGLAQAYRNLVLWFGVELVSPVFGFSGISWLQSLVVLACSIALTISSYRTAKALGSTVAWVWGLAMFVPCLNAITLLVISSKATAACKENGIEVGLFGPKI